MPKAPRQRTRQRATGPDGRTTFTATKPTPVLPKPTVVHVQSDAMEETVVVQRVVPAAPVLSAVSVPEVLSELEGGHAADHLKKKEKRRERHDRWMQKLGGIYQQARDEKNKKQPDVGSLNLTALHHVLPSAQAPSQDGVQSSSSPHSSGSGHSKKAHVAVSQSARRQAGVNEIIRLQKVIQHPTFKGNPLATIRQHLQNNLAKQNAAQ